MAVAWVLAASGALFSGRVVPGHAGSWCIYSARRPGAGGAWCRCAWTAASPTLAPEKARPWCAELDSPQPVVICVAAWSPIFFAYSALRHAGACHGTDRLLACFVKALQGVSRLARCQHRSPETWSGDDGKVKCFETPIPPPSCWWSPARAGRRPGPGWPRPCGAARWCWRASRRAALVLLFAASGSLMISRIRIPKLCCLLLKIWLLALLYKRFRACFCRCQRFQAAVGLRFTGTMPPHRTPGAAQPPGLR